MPRFTHAPRQPVLQALALLAIVGASATADASPTGIEWEFQSADAVVSGADSTDTLLRLSPPG